jgi:hypothetical protein
MAFRASDGKAFGNRQKMKAYEERSSTAKEPRGTAKAEDADEEEREEEAKGGGQDYAGDADDGPQDSSQRDIGDVLNEAGPAESITITHDHENGRHTVSSKHGKITHNSTHPNADEAHSHAARAAGLSAGMGQAAQAGMQGIEQEEPRIPGFMP